MSTLHTDDEGRVAVSKRRIAQRYDYSTRQIERYMRDPSFPRPIRPGGAVRLYLDEVDAWFASRRESA